MLPVAYNRHLVLPVGIVPVIADKNLTAKADTNQDSELPDLFDPEWDFAGSFDERSPPITIPNDEAFQKAFDAALRQVNSEEFGSAELVSVEVRTRNRQWRVFHHKGSWEIRRTRLGRGGDLGPPPRAAAIKYIVYVALFNQVISAVGKRPRRRWTAESAHAAVGEVVPKLAARLRINQDADLTLQGLSDNLFVPLRSRTGKRLTWTSILRAKRNRVGELATAMVAAQFKCTASTVHALMYGRKTRTS